jgi:peptidoglycan/xylan/chitin deacetylase (PgdA/CDA1 family)
MDRFTKKVKKYTSTALVSLLVLFAVSLPVYVTGKWVYAVVGGKDPRKVVASVQFQSRSIDSSDQLMPFKEPVISITFDDGWETVYTDAFPVLQKNGFHTTQYIIAGSLNNISYMSVGQLEAMHSAGTEIGSHTMTHPDLTTLTTQDLNWELGQSKQILSQNLGPITDFASPLGSYNAYTIKAIQKYYDSHKNAEGDPNEDPLSTINLPSNYDKYDLKAYSVRSYTKLNDIQKLLDETIKNNGWLILTYHQIDDSGEEYSVNSADFQKQIELISRSPIKSATVHQVLSRLEAKQ